MMSYNNIINFYFCWLLYFVVHGVLGCLPAGNANLVTIGKATYFCIIVNDRYIMVATPTADTYSRVIIRGSFNATTKTAAPNGYC